MTEVSGSLLPVLLVGLAVGGSAAFSLFHLVARLTRWPASVFAVVGVLALAASATFLFADSVRRLFLSDGKEVESAFVAFVLAVGAIGEAAWIAWLSRRTPRPRPSR